MFILGCLSVSVIFMDFGLSPVMIMKFFFTGYSKLYANVQGAG